MTTILYFDGLTAQSHECEINITDEFVYIYIKHEKDKCITWKRSLINYFDLNGNNLIIKYSDFPQQTIDCKGNDSHEFFKKLSENNLAKKSKSIWLKNKATFALVLTVAFVVICLGSYFVFLPWIGEKSAALIPKSIEIELGDNIAQSISQSSSIKDSSSYFANLFVSKIKTDSNYPIEITIIKSNEINAFALPGGKIFIYSGILEKIKSYEEFTALIGHEISHVSCQHSLKSICRSAASSIFISFMFGDISGVSAGILQQADQFKQLNYSRELEIQADNEGYKLMLRNKISPKGMIDLLKLLQKESHDTPNFMKYMSTHPETNERIRNVRLKSKSFIIFEENKELEDVFKKIKIHLK